MKPHYHVEQDGLLELTRVPRRRTAWTTIIQKALDRPTSTWRVVSCSGCTRTHV